MTSLLNNLALNVLFKLSLEEGEFVFDREPRCAPTFEIEEVFGLHSEKDKVDGTNNNVIDSIRRKIEEITGQSDFEKHKTFDESIVGFLSDIDINYCAVKKQLISSFQIV